MSFVNLLDLVYPVGSYYISSNKTSPAILFGGTWTEIKNRFLYAVPTTKASLTIGGSNTHTLTIDEMPSHAHTMTQANNEGTYEAWVNVPTKQKASASGPPSGYSGKGKPHNNMPAYQEVYCWTRTK